MLKGQNAKLVVARTEGGEAEGLFGGGGGQWRPSEATEALIGSKEIVSVTTGYFSAGLRRSFLAFKKWVTRANLLRRSPGRMDASV